MTIVTNPNGLDYEFEGELLSDATFIREDDGAHLAVWKTDNGNYVCTVKYPSGNTGIYITKQAHEILNYYGFSAGSKLFYKAIGLYTTKKV